MRAVLRRASGPRHSRLSVRDLEIDLAARIVTVGGESIQLSAKEYELLVALAEDPNGSSRKRTCSATSGAFARWAARARSTRTRRASAAS